MHILLIISGGIAAYKSLELIRRLQDHNIRSTAILTKAAQEFVTPLSVSALSQNHVYTDLFNLTDENDMGHIQLSRSADLILVCPASADLLAKMASGLCDDLATTTLLATDTDVMVAPAMNVRMWEHPATKDNIEKLKSRNIKVIAPDEGPMACGEYGPGRLPDIPVIVQNILEFRDAQTEKTANAVKPLAGKTAIVTSGPTHEPIDPVRYIANRSSGKQGHAIAKALADAGATVTLVSGPTQQPDPLGVMTKHVETAQNMHDAVHAALPADIAIFAAAVADWRVDGAQTSKIKKEAGQLPSLSFTENPDILKSVAKLDAGSRPRLVVGFAAETDHIIDNARSKLIRKGCDWLLANSVATGTQTFGGDHNTITFLTKTDDAESWPSATKDQAAHMLVQKISQVFSEA